MTDALALDFATLDGQLSESGARAVDAPADPWLQRRALGFGASDIPALLIAMGKRAATDAPKYIADRARTTNRTHGVARIFAEKVGVLAPEKVGAAALKGTLRERELLSQWRTMLSRGVYADESEALIVPSSVRHADVGMRCAMPWLDRHEPRLTATLDGWADDVLGQELVLELKCSASERRELPWYWRDQVQAQLAVTGAEWGVLVCGEMWSAWHGNDGPIRVWPVQRDEAVIADIRDAVRTGWAIVERLKQEVL